MNGRLARREELGPPERAEMFALLASHFEGVLPDVFDRDLDEKNWVLLFTDGGRLKGFTTFLAYDTVHQGEPLSVVCSGDTIMSREGWNTSALPRSWIAAVRSIQELQFVPGRRLYWLLLTSGFRTYRLLPVFWREFYPRHDAATPEPVRLLMGHLARERFGPCFDAERGVVTFPFPQMLRGALRDVSAGRLSDPHVAFFLERNPGWPGGDELVCVTEIDPGNLTAAGRRMFGQVPTRLTPTPRSHEKDAPSAKPPGPSLERAG
jgi:hypothetical protein